MCDDNPGKQAHIHTVMRETCWILQETAAALSVGGCQRPSLHWRTDPRWEAEQAGQLCGGHEAALTGDSCRETAGHPGWSQAPSAPSHQQPEGSCCGRLLLPTCQSHRLRDSSVPWAIKLCNSSVGGGVGATEGQRVGRDNNINSLHQLNKDNQQVQLSGSARYWPLRLPLFMLIVVC